MSQNKLQCITLRRLDTNTPTCICGPAVAMAAIVSGPMESTMFLNLVVSMVDSSLAFVISSSFCSLAYFISASRALVSLSSSESYTSVCVCVCVCVCARVCVCVCVCVMTNNSWLPPSLPHYPQRCPSVWTHGFNSLCLCFQFGLLHSSFTLNLGGLCSGLCFGLSLSCGLYSSTARQKASKSGHMRIFQKTLTRGAKYERKVEWDNMKLRVLSILNTHCVLCSHQKVT